MAEIVNLRRARKARTRAEDEARAAEKRLRFGRPKAERDKSSAESGIAARRLDGHKREPADEP